MSDWQDTKATIASDDGWEDVVDKKGKPAFLKQAAGVAAGVADIAGQGLAGIAPTVKGLYDIVTTKEDPRVVEKAIEASSEGANPANLIPSIEEYRKTGGHKAVSDLAHKLFMTPIEQGANVVGWGRHGAGRLFGESKEDAMEASEKLMSAFKVGAFGSLPFMRGTRPAPGSAGAYRELAASKPTEAQVQASEKARATYPEGGWQDTKAKVDTTKYNQMDLPLGEEPSAIPRDRQTPYNLTPEQIAALERELNPATEQRVAGQGELFTPERALTPDELIERKFPLEEPVRGARDRVPSPEAERLQMDTPARVGEMESRMGQPEQMTGAMDNQRGLPFPDAAADSLGGMGEAALSGRERRGLDSTRRQMNQIPEEGPIPYVRPIGPRSQRGVISEDLLTMGVGNAIRNLGVREALKKFSEGTFHPKIFANQIRKALERDSTNTVVWMKPNDFHRLANERTPDWERQSEAARRGIRGALATKEGLTSPDAIPELKINSSGKVVAHEGRHRMDVFAEQGLDLVPVVIKSDSIKWNDGVANRPKQLSPQDRAWNPDDRVMMPELISDQIRKENILSKHRPMASQTGAMNFWQKKTDSSVAKKGVAETFRDMQKMFTRDTRPIQQVLSDEGITPETMTDLAAGDQKLASRLDAALQKGLSNFAIDKQLAILAANKGPVGKLVKWVVDNQGAITRTAKLRIEQAIESGLEPWKKLKRADSKSLREALTIWQDNIGKEKLTAESFRDPRQWEVYKALSDQMSDGWKRVNEARQKAGLKSIEFVENYFPAIREGDYWIHIIDGEGKLQHSSAYQNIREATAAHKLLQKEFGSEFTVKDPTLKKRGKYDLSSFAAFEETIKAMDKNDPIRQAIQQRYSQIIGKRGFGKTGIMKKDIGGALGFEPGKEGLKNSERVLESYFKRQESYIANLERGQLQKQLREVPAEIWDKAPIAKNYIDTYLDRARGAQLDLTAKGEAPLLRAIVEEMSTTAGYGRNLPRKFIQQASSIASLMWLVTPRFLLSQFAQPLNAFAKLVDMYQLGDSVTNPAKAFFDGYVEAFSPDAMSKEARKWAKKNGHLESTIVSLLEMKLHDLQGEGWKLIDDAARWALGRMESQVVRTPVFHVFEKALREQVKDNTQRFEMAAQLMDNYMVNYERESGPLIYDKAGLIGEAARPLKTYAHNYWGQFFEYAQTATDKGRVAPLATQLATQTLVSGMKGVILVAEATAIINMVNAMFSTDIPTPEELLLESNVPDYAIYGGYSYALGRDISTSMASPSMPALLSFPPIEFTAKAAKEVWTYMRKSLSGTATEQDEMRALLSISPNAARGWIEALYSPEEGYIPNPNDKMKGNFPVPQDAHEKAIRFGLSLKSIEESKLDAIARTAKKFMARDIEQRIGALDAMIPYAEQDKDIPEKLIERYVEEGGDLRGLMRNIRNRMIDKQQSFFEREETKALSPNQIKRLDTIKRFMDEDLMEEMEKQKPDRRSSVESPGFRKAAVFGPPADYNKSLAPVVNEKERTAQAMHLRTITAQAERLFPSNPDKQRMWMRALLEKEIAHGEELRDFRLKMRERRSPNYRTEM